MVNKLLGISGIFLIIALLGSTVVLAGWGFHHKGFSDKHKALFTHLKESNASPDEWKEAMADFGIDKTSPHVWKGKKNFHKRWSGFSFFGSKEKFFGYGCRNK